MLEEEFDIKPGKTSPQMCSRLACNKHIAKAHTSSKEAYFKEGTLYRYDYTFDHSNASVAGAESKNKSATAR